MHHCCFELEIGLKSIVCMAHMTNVSLNNSYRSLAISLRCVNGPNDARYVWLIDGCVRHALSR